MRICRICFRKEKSKGENWSKVGRYKYGIKSPYKFFLGGTDSCQGDSGGPLISFSKLDGVMRGYALGAVSRGTGCANFNKPGIFTRVSHHIEWVKKIAGEGTCDSQANKPATKKRRQKKKKKAKRGKRGKKGQKAKSLAKRVL